MHCLTMNSVIMGLTQTTMAVTTPFCAVDLSRMLSEEHCLQQDAICQSDLHCLTMNSIIMGLTQPNDVVTTPFS